MGAILPTLARAAAYGAIVGTLIERPTPSKQYSASDRPGATILFWTVSAVAFRAIQCYCGTYIAVGVSIGFFCAPRDSNWNQGTGWYGDKDGFQKASKINLMAFALIGAAVAYLVQEVIENQ